MAVVIEAAEEGGVDPFIAYGIEAGSDDEDGNYDDADDVDGVQAGNDDELRAAEVRAAEVCAAKVRAVEVRAAELRAAELRAAELRAAEIRAAEIRATEIRAAEVRAVEDRAAAVRAADVRSAEARQTELAPHTSQPNNPTAPVRLAGAHHFREAQQLEAQLRDLQNTVSTLNAQLQEARARIKAVEAERDSLKTQLESMQRQLSAEVAGTSSDVGTLRDPSDPLVRMENVQFQPHLVRKYIAEGTTQDEYYLFMGGNSKRIDRALKVEWPLENHKGKKGHASLDNNETNNRNNVHAKTRVVAAWLKETLEREPATFKIDEPMGFEMGIGKVRILIEGYELFFFPSGVVPTPWPPINNM
ncbi:unnamed protein product [Closterium sp. NIES-65]|nr:unnamed protein product [Closterium sp. NIES-65]